MKSVNVLNGAWKIMLPSALLLYTSYLLFSAFSVYTAKITGQFLDNILSNDSASASSMLFRLGIALGVSIFIMPLIDLVTNLICFKQGMKHDRIIISEFFKKKYKKMKEFNVGEASSRLSNDPNNFRTSVVFIPIRCLAYCSVLVITSILMLQIHALLSMLMFVLIIGSLASTFYFSKKISNYSEQQKRYREDVQLDIIDMVENQIMFKSYNMDYAIVNRFLDKFQKYYDNVFKKENILTNGISFARELILLSGIGVLLALSVVYLNSGVLTTGKIVTLYYYMNTVKSLASQIAGFVKEFSQIPKNIERLQELILNKETISGTAAPDNWNNLSVDSIKFVYSSGKEVFSNLSCEIKQNELVQLVGDNGTGKTTFINILCGLYPVSCGNILLRNMPFEKYDMILWRDKIAVMNQFPDLFPGTILENVRISKICSSDVEIKKILSYVGLDSMSDRILTGSRDELSGGEQKRLSLARLLLRDAPLIILDEPYENLDVEGKLKIDELLHNEKKTRIFVAHNLNDVFSNKKTIKFTRNM